MTIQVCKKYSSLISGSILAFIALLLVRFLIIDKPINGRITTYTQQDRSSLIKIFNKNKAVLDPKNIGGDFEYQIDHFALNEKEQPGSLHIAVAKNHAKNVVGFVFYYRKALGIGTIYYLAVDEKFRNQQYGTALINYACNDLRKQEMIQEMLITVNHNNPTAEKLYRKLGFNTISAMSLYQVTLKKVL